LLGSNLKILPSEACRQLPSRFPKIQLPMIVTTILKVTLISALPEPSQALDLQISKALITVQVVGKKATQVLSIQFLTVLFSNNTHSLGKIWSIPTLIIFRKEKLTLLLET